MQDKYIQDHWTSFVSSSSVPSLHDSAIRVNRTPRHLLPPDHSKSTDIGDEELLAHVPFDFHFFSFVCVQTRRSTQPPSIHHFSSVVSVFSLLVTFVYRPIWRIDAYWNCNPSLYSDRNCQDFELKIQSHLHSFFRAPTHTVHQLDSLAPDKFYSARIRSLEFCSVATRASAGRH